MIASTAYCHYTNHVSRLLLTQIFMRAQAAHGRNATEPPHKTTVHPYTRIGEQSKQQASGGKMLVLDLLSRPTTDARRLCARFMYLSWLHPAKGFAFCRPTVHIDSAAMLFAFHCKPFLILYQLSFRHLLFGADSEPLNYLYQITAGIQPLQIDKRVNACKACDHIAGDIQVHNSRRQILRSGFMLI